jgi:hypothetical protein
VTKEDAIKASVQAIGAASMALDTEWAWVLFDEHSFRFLTTPSHNPEPLGFARGAEGSEPCLAGSP